MGCDPSGKRLRRQLEQAHLQMDLRDLAEAGATPEVLELWRLRGELRDERLVAAKLGMKVKAVQMALARASDRLLAYREDSTPDPPEPLDFDQFGGSRRRWLEVIAGVVIDRVIDRPELANAA